MDKSSASNAQPAGSGATRHTASDGGVHTTWDIWPRKSIGDLPYTRKRIRGQAEDRNGPKEEDSEEEDDSEEDDSEDENSDNKEGYRKSNDPVRDYRFGTVIEMRLVPPLDRGSAISRITPTPNPRYPGGPTRAGIRRFVVIQAPTTASEIFKALPIKTYNGLGVAAPGVVKSHHCIVYTRSPPTTTGDERPQRQSNGAQEAPMRTQAILVIPKDRTRPLDPMSRLDFFDVTEFDSNVRDVKLYGMADENSLGPLYYQFQAVWAAIVQTTGQLSRAPSETQPQRAPRPPQSGSVQRARVPEPSAAPPEIGPDAARVAVTSNSPIPVAYMIAYLRHVHNQANVRHVRPPPALNSAQIQALADNPQQRAAFLARLTAAFTGEVDSARDRDRNSPSRSASRPVSRVPLRERGDSMGRSATPAASSPQPSPCSSISESTYVASAQRQVRSPVQLPVAAEPRTSVDGGATTRALRRAQESQSPTTTSQLKLTWYDWMSGKLFGRASER